MTDFAQIGKARASVLPSFAEATTALAALAHGGEIERARAAEATHEQYLADARARGISVEDAEKILALADGDAQYLVGDRYAFATAVLGVVAAPPRGEKP